MSGNWHISGITGVDFSKQHGALITHVASTPLRNPPEIFAIGGSSRGIVLVVAREVTMEADTVDGGSLNHRCPNLHFLNSRVLVTGLQDTCSLAAILVPCSISAILLAETCPCLVPLQCCMSCRAYVHTRLR